MVKATLAQDRRDFYTYVIFRRSTGVPCYVGKGKRGRWQHHAHSTHNRHLRNIYAKEGDLPVVIVRERLTNADACETEIALIAAIGRRVDGGPLVNLTVGGEGISGLPKSAKSLAKSRETMTRLMADPKTKADMVRRATIQRNTSEYHDKHSAILKERYKDPEYYARAVSNLAKISADPVVRTKISRALAGQPKSEGCKEKLRRSALRRMSDPAMRARAGAAKIGKKLSTEHREKIGAAGRGKRHAPDHVEKVAAAQRGRPKACGPGLVAYHAAMTPEQRAQRSARISAATKAAMLKLRQQEAGEWLVDLGPETRERANAVQSAEWESRSVQREQLSLLL